MVNWLFDFLFKISNLIGLQTVKSDAERCMHPLVWLLYWPRSRTSILEMQVTWDLFLSTWNLDVQLRILAPVSGLRHLVVPDNMSSHDDLDTIVIGICIELDAPHDIDHRARSLEIRHATAIILLLLTTPLFVLFLDFLLFALLILRARMSALLQLLLEVYLGVWSI